MAAALLLKDEGAKVTVLDSAEEHKLLKSTIDNLRAQNIRVICGAAADQNTDKYDFVVASPGIDPASVLFRNFSKRKIDIIGELELASRAQDRHHRRARARLAFRRNAAHRHYGNEWQNN